MKARTKVWHADADARAQCIATGGCGQIRAFGNDTAARTRWVTEHVCEAPK